MKPTSPVLLDVAAMQQQEIVLGENQPQYVPLPALCQTVAMKDNVLTGPFVKDIRQANYVMMRWELSDEDIERIRESKSIYVSTWKTQGEFFNPIAVSAEPPITAADITFTPVAEPEKPIHETESADN